MKNKIHVSVLFFSIFLFSCSRKNDSSVYKALFSSLENSNIVIANQSLSSEKSLQRKLADPQTAEKAFRWFPKAMAVKTYTADILKSIDSLKNEFMEIAVSKNSNNEISFNENDMAASSNYFDKERNGEKLKQNLLRFYQKVLLVDEEMTSIFREDINIEIKLLKPEERTKKDFTETFFKNIPAIAALAMLEKFKNDINIIESKFLAFCDNKIANIDHSNFRI